MYTRIKRKLKYTYKWRAGGEKKESQEATTHRVSSLYVSKGRTLIM